MQIIFLHHSSFLVEVDDKVLIFDYFDGDKVNGFTFTGKIPEYAPETKIYMFASHSHKDHYDMDILRLAEKYKNIRLLPVTNVNKLWRDISYFAVNHHMGTDAVYLPRTDPDKMKAARQKEEHIFTTGKLDQDSMYILDEKILLELFDIIDKDNVMLCKIDDLYVALPNWKEIAPYIPSIKQVDLDEILPIIHSSEFILMNIHSHPYLLGKGWSHAEPWGTWSLGKESHIHFMISDDIPKILHMEVHPFLYQGVSAQKVTAYINGKYAGQYSVTKRQILSIPLEGYGKKIDLRLTYSHPASPSSVRGTTDKRVIALGLISLRLDDAGFPATAAQE